MRQKTDKSNTSNEDLKIDRPITRSYVRQEAKINKVYSKCTLYSSVKNESSSSEINEHENTLSSGSKNRYRGICDITFTTRKTYVNHELRTHKTKETPTIDLKSRRCDMCKKKYNCHGVYLRHLIRTHDIILPEIYVEPSDFELKGSYCKVCDMKYKHQKNFIIHLRDIHGIETSSRSSVVIPKTNDQNNYCTLCDRTFCNKQTCIDHLVAFHIEKMPEINQGIDCELPSSGDLKFKRYCADCKKVFLSKMLCGNHLDKTHGIKPLKKSPNMDSIDMNDPNNHCTPCDKTFLHKHNYRRHLNRVHCMPLPSSTHRGVIIGSTISVTDRLNKYCNACNKTYKSICTYRTHMSSFHRVIFRSTVANHNEIPAIDEINKHCIVCDITYRNRKPYKNHLYKEHGIEMPRKIHTPLQKNTSIIPDMDNKNNYCASCNRTYSSRPAYTRHLAQLHNMKKIKIKEDTKEKLNILPIKKIN